MKRPEKNPIDHQLDIALTIIAAVLGWLFVIAVTGCSHLPTLPTQRPGDVELRAFIAARQAHDEFGRSMSTTEWQTHCAHLEPSRIHVAYGSQDEVTHDCRQDELILACSWVGHADVLSPAETWIVVSTHGRDDDVWVTERTRASLLIHEFSHVARACFFSAGDPSERYERYHRGEDPERPVTDGALDPHHRDLELWNAIEARAIELWRDAR